MYCRNRSPFSVPFAALPILVVALASCSGAPGAGPAGEPATPPLQASTARSDPALTCTVNPSSTIQDGVDSPQTVVLDGDGDLYVANFQGSTVTVYAGADPHLRETIASDVDHPTAIALDGLGKLYVANSNSTVTVFEARSGRFVREIDQNGALPQA